LSKEKKRDSNVSLLILGILILVTGVVTSSVFSASLAFADSGDSDKKSQELKEKVKQALEKAKQAIQQQKEKAQKAKEERAKAEQLAKEQAEKKALEEQQAKEEAEKKALEEQQAKEEAQSEENSNSSEEVTETTTEEQVVDDNSSEEVTETTTEESNEEANSQTDETGQDIPSIDRDVLTIIPDPIEIDVDSEEGEMTVVVDHIEDSSDGKMVYLNGNGARESARITITVFGEDNDEIVELGIYSTNSGEFSTIWIAGGDMNIDGTYVVKVTDNQKTAQTSFKLNGEPVQTVTEETEASTNDSQGDTSETPAIETISTLPEDPIDPNATVDERVGALESLVNAMQAVINSLTNSLNSFQAQLEAETQARQDADNELQGKINEISSNTQRLVAYERAMYINIASGEQSAHTITCPDGDVAQTGGIDIKSEEVTNFKTFANRMDGTTGWYVQAANNNPTNSVEMKLFVNCLKVEFNQSTP
jgi:chemotaxis protein histidine kinase CheA